jgi:hypothetical protein
MFSRFNRERSATHTDALLSPAPPFLLLSSLIYTSGWNSISLTPPTRRRTLNARTGRLPGSAFSSPRCLKAAACRTQREPRACRGPARIACARGWPARHSTVHGNRRWRSTPAAWQILSRTAEPVPPRPGRLRKGFEGWRAAVARPSRRWRASVAPMARICRADGASMSPHGCLPVAKAAKQPPLCRQRCELRTVASA